MKKMVKNCITDRIQLLSLFVMVMMLLAACGSFVGRSPAQEVDGGDPDRGQIAIQTYGCNSCHKIPGILRADASVGPPLDFWADRHYIAGTLPNTPDNLIVWIRFPQSIEPGTAMPDMGVTENDARDIAAYLYTLRRSSLFDLPGMMDRR